MDSRLAHLIEAKRSLLDRWKKQRLNRRLRKKVAELNRAIQGHCRALCVQQWNEICNAADGQLHCGRTWNLLRHLLDETKSKSHQRDRLTKLMHRAIQKHGEEEVLKKINDKYLPPTLIVQHGPYQGLPNKRLDREIDVEEVRVALHDLNSKSAAGPDLVTNKSLRNLDDHSIENLTKFYNKCWKTGSLPRQWKTAKTILIPKPGKPPDTDNLRPISLTSCVGKVLEHVLLNRWQDYLESEDLYPTTVIGFRKRLSTQDAMIQLKHEILDDSGASRDNKAILGLDLQSAFDNVKHSAILSQVSKLNMGERSYNYIQDFLTGRTAQLRAGHLQLDDKKLGSTGTPQGSVISPLLFNLVMIGVANRLATVGIRHTIYADDITLWVDRGSDGHIETKLQEAVDAIEEHLDGTGLVCSPSKSELLVIPPRRGRTTDRQQGTIRITTRSGQIVPEVSKIRVLGMIIERHRRNGETIARITAKTADAMRLIRRVTSRKAGMKEDSLIRLVHSFVISHITYVAAYHNWLQHERNKINAIIRRAYKSALGLFESTSTPLFLKLGVHNTLEEIAEAQRTAQLERLSTTRTGRKILEDLGYIRHSGGDNKLTIPDEIRRRIRVDLLPKNMHPDYNKGRRAARAKALVDLHAQDRHARYVDAAEYPHEAFAAVVIKATTGDTVTAASVKCTDAERAEEVAIALAITDAGCQSVISDSRTAVRNYAKGRICKEALQVLRNACLEGARTVRVKWIPAHAGKDVSSKNANHNETAHAEARALTNRAPATDRPTWFGAKDRMTDYSEITKAYRLARRTFPPPDPGLSRAEAVLLRQLQTGSLPTPALMHRMYPEAYPTAMCQLCCRETADQKHILWNCVTSPMEARSRTIPPRLAEAARSYTYENQHWAVQQVLRALARHETRESATASSRLG
ncbi:uncharacterized protein LOC144180295 [Haemaphysalis longicornis]